MAAPGSHRDEAERSRLERARQRTAALQERAQRVAERAQAERARHSSVDAVFEMVDRDAEVGGGIIAGALAYRFFLWLLPFALVLVAVLGLAADASDETPKQAAKSLGVAGLVTHSVASASNASNRWYALLIGIPILLYVTRGVLRALIGVHRLVWGDIRAAAPRPTPGATLKLLLLLLGYFAVSVAASAVRARTGGGGLLVSLVLVIPYAGFWLLVSLRLPHRGATWLWLLPGAVLCGAGIEVLQLVAAYLIMPYALSKQGTYGALGIAAALLFGLYVLSRLVIGSAVLNATLWERRTRAVAEPEA
jgi:uncharacterized BrkB/YihY/UPF0761 family membrane protein